MNPIEQALEQITGQTTVPASVEMLTDWFIKVLQDVAGSPTPAETAQSHAGLLANHKGEIAAAVAANT